MPDACATPAWDRLAAELRTFVARRIDDPADVDDVVQETLLRMHRNLGDLSDGAAVGAWMTRIARHAIIDRHRDRAARTRRHDRAAADPAIGPAPTTAPADLDAPDPAALLSACVVPFVDALPEPYARALHLTELQGMTQRQAAEHEGISLSGMKSPVQRGRALLRDELERCCQIALDARGRVIEATPRACDGCG